MLIFRMNSGSTLYSKCSHKNGHKNGLIVSPDEYPQTKVGDTYDSVQSHRRRDFLSDAIT